MNWKLLNSDKYQLSVYNKRGYCNFAIRENDVNGDLKWFFSIEFSHENNQIVFDNSEDKLLVDKIGVGYIVLRFSESLNEDDIRDVYITINWINKTIEIS